MSYIPCQFDRVDYLKDEELFEAIKIDDVDMELCEFNDDAEDLAFELAYTRYRVSKLELLIKNLVENGYISVPEESGPETDVFFRGDVELLTRYGLKELKNRGYHEVINRLARAGII